MELRLLRRQTTDLPAASWLWNRAGFGPRPGDLDAIGNLSATDAIDWFVDPDAHDVVPAPEPWIDSDYENYEPGPAGRELVGQAISDWVDAMATGSRPLVEQMAWFWHGHLVSGLDKVRNPYALIVQVRRFRRLSLDGNLGTLLREITTDAAMLRYLDGADSVGGAPNENYSRELLELFALGIGNYTEADVKAGAIALTGWTSPRRRNNTTNGIFRPRRHDDTPQIYLGQSGVSDVETVIEAVLAHPACGPFVARSIARHLLGPGVDATATAAMGVEFANDGYRFRPLLRSILTYGLDHQSELQREAAGPVAWLVSAARALEIPTIDGRLVRGLQRMGQVPLAPPNVAGWPRGDAWLSATATLGRANVALALAALASADGVARAAAERGDMAALASILGVASGFSDVNAEVITSVSATAERLALALVTDEVVRR